MKLLQLAIPTALLVIFLAVPRANADFLGLAPGDYTITLQGSTTLCNGSNCVGTVHIGSSGFTGFSWLFTIDNNNFDFASPFAEAHSEAFSDCAVESLTSLVFTSCSDILPGKPFLQLNEDFIFGSTFHVWSYESVEDSDGGNWTAVPRAVPEPVSSSLLLFGLSALGLRRWLRSKQD